MTRPFADKWREAFRLTRTWPAYCDTCGCDLTYPLEVQPDCRYPDCENCHESETAHRAADGDR